MYKVYTLSSSNDVDNVRYVGVTRKDLKERLWGHACQSIGNKRKFLWYKEQKALGYDVIITQIDTAIDSVEVSEKEKMYIKKYRENGFDLLNIATGGLSERNYDTTYQYKDKPSKYRVQQICPYKLEVIAVYEGIYNAERLTGIKGKSIQMCIKKQRHFCKDFFWRFVPKEIPLSFDIDEDFKNKLKLHMHATWGREIVIPKKERKWENNIQFMGSVYQIDIKTKTIVNSYTSCTDAGYESELLSKKISVCVNGKRLSTNGFGWIRSHKKPTLDQINNLVDKIILSKKNKIFNMQKMQKYKTA